MILVETTARMGKKGRKENDRGVCEVKYDIVDML
jgi:hypothetical protein